MLIEEKRSFVEKSNKQKKYPNFYQKAVFKTFNSDRERNAPKVHD